MADGMDIGTVSQGRKDNGVMLLGFRFLAVGSDYSLGGKLPIVMEFPTFCPHTWMGFCSGCYLPW